MGDNGAIARFLADHDGVVTIDQALSCGLSRGEIKGRVARGDWLAMARGLYRSATHPVTESSMIRAAVLAYRGVADRTTAAWWHGLLDVVPEGITLSCAQARAPLDWPVSIRSVRRRYGPSALTTVRDLPITRKPLTALMTSVELDEGSQFLDRALQTKAVTLVELQRAIDDNAGICGMAQARRLVAVAASDSESAAERLFVTLLKDRGLTGWVQQLWLGPWRMDFAWPDLQIAVEISGWSYHRDVRRHGNDLAKANYLESIGWRELQFDWHMINDSGEDCIQQVINVIDARSTVDSW